MHPAEGQQSHQLGAALGGKQAMSRDNAGKAHLSLARADCTLIDKQRPRSEAKKKKQQLSIQKNYLERYIYHSNFLEYT